MLLPLLLAVQAAPAAAAQPALAPADVVVTGERLKRLHDGCRAGGCGPLRDAQVSLAWAEAQFREGRYLDAKRTLRDAAGRNGRHAATAPKPVAAIYEAYATVAWQEGDQFAYRRATAARVRALRENLPPEDAHVQAAALALGDMWLRLSQPLEARRAYERAERDALAAGRGVTALRARLARAQLARRLGDAGGADALLDGAASLPGADAPASRAAIAVARLRRTEGRAVDLSPLVSLLRRAEFRRPVLVYDPPLPVTEAEHARRIAGSQPSILADGFVNAEFLGNSQFEFSSISWGDIGFWIRPDGTVAEAELLNGSRDRRWAKPFLDYVGKRRYLPGAASGPDDPGVYRLERFTLRSAYNSATGSLILGRRGFRDVEIFDLTEQPKVSLTAR